MLPGGVTNGEEWLIHGHG